jgi:spore coat polysaccharide biosynthesis protein SpsF
MDNKTSRIVCIVQARMGSVRLPGKMMKEILGKPMLFYVLNQLKFCKQINQVVLATSTLPDNDAMCDYAKKLGYEVFRGSEDDVLDRTLQAAKKFRADIIVRVTGDEPLIDPKITDEVIKDHLKSGADYTSTKIRRIMAQGMDSEVFATDVLEEVAEIATSDYDREHVTPYIYNHLNDFHINAYEPSNKKRIYPEDQRPILTVDDQKDFDFVTIIIKQLYKEGKPILLDDIIAFLKKA